MQTGITETSAMANGAISGTCGGGVEWGQPLVRPRILAEQWQQEDAGDGHRVLPAGHPKEPGPLSSWRAPLRPTGSPGTRLQQTWSPAAFPDQSCRSGRDGGLRRWPSIGKGPIGRHMVAPVMPCQSPTGKSPCYDIAQAT